MAKEFLDELMEELQKLKDEQKTITISAPVAPHKVIKAINQVVKHHELTQEEKQMLVEVSAAMDGTISPAEQENLEEIYKA